MAPRLSSIPIEIHIDYKLSTYSGGTRADQFTYATNNIDTITVANALGVQVSSNSYNAFHQVLANYNALNEITSYTYNTNQQVTSITLPNGLVTTNIFGANNLLSQQIVVGFATNTFTYTNDLVFTHGCARPHHDKYMG